MLAILRIPICVAALLLAAGCATRPVPVAVVPAAAPFVAYTPPPPAISAINRGLSPAATAWHLRVALNVAALACRGPAELAIVADYNALLATQRSALARTQAVLSAEYRARGGDWQDSYDDAMTRLYNFFSQAQVRDAFCATAADVLAETRMLAPGAFGDFAVSRLAAIDVPFARAFPPAALPAPVVFALAPVRSSSGVADAVGGE